MYSTECLPIPKPYSESTFLGFVSYCSMLVEGPWKCIPRWALPLSAGNLNVMSPGHEISGTVGNLIKEFFFYEFRYVEERNTYCTEIRLNNEKRFLEISQIGGLNFWYCELNDCDDSSSKAIQWFLGFTFRRFELWKHHELPLCQSVFWLCFFLYLLTSLFLDLLISLMMICFWWDHLIWKVESSSSHAFLVQSLFVCWHILKEWITFGANSLIWEGAWWVFGIDARYSYGVTVQLVPSPTVERTFTTVMHAGRWTGVWNNHAIFWLLYFGTQLGCKRKERFVSLCASTLSIKVCW